MDPRYPKASTVEIGVEGLGNNEIGWLFTDGEVGLERWIPADGEFGTVRQSDRVAAHTTLP